MRNIILLLLFTFTQSLHGQQSDFNGIKFWKSDQIAKQYKGEDLNNLPKLAYDLTSQLNTDVERFRAIYYWVCHNIRGEFNLMYKNERIRNKLKSDPKALNLWNNQFKKEVFTRLLQNKETLCTGYSYLIKELSNLAGLECEIIYGYGEENKVSFENIDAPNHSWNVVKLNEKWYLSDATWSAGFIDMSTFLFEYKYENRYFLMDPSEFVRSHRPIHEQWTLVLQNSKVIPINK